VVVEVEFEMPLVPGEEREEEQEMEEGLEEETLDPLRFTELSLDDEEKEENREGEEEEGA